MSETTVSEIMSRNPVSVKPNNTLQDVYHILKSNRYASLAVTDKENIVGIITWYDLRKFSSEDHKNISVKEAMSKNPIIISEDTLVSEVKRIMDEKRYASLLVGKNKKLVGIVTRGDITEYENRNQTPKPTHIHYTPTKHKSNFLPLVIFIIITIAIIYAVSFFISSSTVTSTDELSDISRIYISSKAYTILENAWASNNKVEFKYCMYVKKYGDGYIIYDLYEPKIQFATGTEVVTDICDYKSAGYIHSHPIGNCLMSSPTNSMETGLSDADNLMTERFPLAGIMCNPDKISMYTKNQYTKSIQLILINNDNSSQDITVTNPCRGNYFCNGECSLGCSTPYEVWSCTPSGGHCEYDPNNCPPGQHSCNGKCWQGCTAQGTWSCTSNGGMCKCNIGVTSCSI